jgi:hypothetical protein
VLEAVMRDGMVLRVYVQLERYDPTREPHDQAWRYQATLRGKVQTPLGEWPWVCWATEKTIEAACRAVSNVWEESTR